MRVRQILVGCLAGAVAASAVPAAAAALPSPGSAAPALFAAPAAPYWGTATLAPSLQRLRSEVDLRWPGRSRASDGWLGDSYHQRSASDHNPVGHGNGPGYGTPGSVHAIDITAAGVDVNAVLNAVLGDSRVWYVIHNHTIWSRTYGWAPRRFSGNGHTTHIHISLRADSQAAAVAAERDTSPWLPVPVSVASLSSGQVRALQQALIARGFSIPAGATGTYGRQTRAAVAAFQRSQGWSGSGADGSAGPQTLRLLGVTGGSTVRYAPASAAAPASRPSGSAASAGRYTPGASGAHIAAMQRALIARGSSIPSGPTGLYGPQTRAAVAAFQRAQGWTGAQADGIPGPATLARLGLGGAPASAAPAPRPAAPTGNYAPGASGAHIKALQANLIKLGYSIPSGATGFFGAETQRAVAAFQRAQGWSGSKADGLPGPATLGRLGLR